PIIELEADEAEALEPLVRLSSRVWDVRRRHADAKHSALALGPGDRRQEQRPQQSQSYQAQHELHTGYTLGITLLHTCLLITSLPPLPRGRAPVKLGALCPRSGRQREHECSLFLYPQGRQILVPRLRLHIALHLGAQGPRVEVVNDKQPGGVLD